MSKPELFQEWNDEMEYMSGRIKVGSTSFPDSPGFRVDSPGFRVSVSKGLQLEHWQLQKHTPRLLPWRPLWQCKSFVAWQLLSLLPCLLAHWAFIHRCSWC